MKFLQALFPEQASTMAGRYDALFYFLCALSIVVGFTIVGVIAVFVVRYRRRAEDPTGIRKVGMEHDEMRRMEYLWIGAPLVVFLAIFYWGAVLFASFSTPPADAQQVFVVGKQWMWKLQHLEGVREIEAHVTNTMGWSATTGEVAPWVYQHLAQTYMLDDAMRERLAALNPTASAKIANRLIEAHERRYWSPDPEMLDALRRAGEDLEDRMEGITQGVPA